ncbi:hypothetical protein VdG2_04425 [Verticillium dahliae VDG2]|nr:hypothetical protein VdG2_04425 [Verticillium dahliae VDG2]
MNRLFSRVLPAPAAIPHISTAPIHTSAPCHAQRIYPTNYTPKGIGLSPINPRKPAPPPPGWTPFAISNLLLDLDAYESRYVRPYDDAADDARQRAAWAANPTRDALKQAARDFSPEFRRANFLFAEAHGARSSRKWRVGELDLFAGALLGVRPAKEGAQASPGAAAKSPSAVEELAIVVRQNAIPSSAAQGERLLEWLVHRPAQLDETLPPDAVALESRIEPRETTKLDAETGGSSANAGQQRPEWSGFLSWKRLVTAILQTETGVAILAKRKEELARTMEGLLTPENALDQLVFLNNLHARFHADGVELGLHLCGAGLVLAAEARQGRALTRYLSLGAGSGYWRASTSREGALAAIPDLMLQNLRAVLVKADDGSISFDGSASKLLVALDSDAAVAGSSIEQLAPAGRQPQAASS